ncbi:MAG: signal peptide peptidase SppA [candidate division NC10 bacterium]|nr:signal peptide peptidase SppA [candidate division NC10 bacterium]
MQKTRGWRAVSWIGGGGFLFLLLLFLLNLYLGGEGPGRGKIGLVHIEGIILDSKEVLQQLEKHRSNQAIKAVVVRINSPGGGVAAAQEIYEELDKIRSRQGKPVVVSMGGLAASGGYYIACASDRIFANPGTITGSIGVIMQLANISQLMEKLGIKSVIIKSGVHKDMGSFTKEVSPEDQRIFQGVLDDAHDQFMDAVAKGRRIDKERVRMIADGRIFTGRQAMSLGLVDELGDLSDAISYAAQRAGIKGTPRIVEERRRRLSLLDLLGSKISSFSPAGIEMLRGGTFSVQYLME